MLVIVNIFPLGKGLSLGKEVALAVKEIDKSGLDYRLTAMGTIIEGEWSPVMKLLKKLRSQMLKRSGRIYITITIDDRSGSKGRLRGKVASVEKHLGKKLKS